MSNFLVSQNIGTEQRPSPVPFYLGNTDEPSMADYAKVLYNHRWLITVVTFFSLLCAIFYFVAAKPIYEANFLIHVEGESDKRDPRTMFGEMAAIFNMKTTSSGEIELVRSRLVVSQALEKLNIYVSAEPAYFPVIGKLLAAKDIRLPPPFALKGYSWGNAEISIGNFTVPDDLLNQQFIIAARENGNYDLMTKKGAVIAAGKVGVPLKAEHPAGPIELLVNTLQSEPDVRFRLERSSRLAAIEAVQANLTAAEQGKQSAVIKVALRGNDPVAVNLVLTEIAKQYIAQNAARKTQEATNALAFLNKQLPELKQQLEDSETKYNKYRNSKGTIDLAEEAKSDLQQLALAKTRKMEVEMKRTELAVRFTSNHPVVEGLDTQLRDINKEIRKLTDHIKSLPTMEQELLKLSREMRINTDLYMSLLNTARQLRLVTASATTNVRLVDMPMVPEKSVSAGPVKTLGIGLLAGLVAGMMAAFAKNFLRKGVTDSVEVEEAGNLPVFAVIPHSPTQQKLESNTGTRTNRIPLLAKEAPLDLTVESLRNLRAVLQFSASRQRNNILLIISPTEGNGKSFMSANLAVLLGAGNKRILVIDADLRKGDLHRYFGVGQALGLAEALAGRGDINTFIHHAVSQNVDFISAGKLPADPELLMQPGLKQLLNMLARQYDMVLINGAPLLEVSDSLAIGAYAGSVFVVARAGLSTQDEIAETVKILQQAGLSANGCVLNGVKPRRRSAYGYRYGYGRGWGNQSLFRNASGSDIVSKS